MSLDNHSETMEMPSDYVDMDSDELEYDGGLSRLGTILLISGIAVAGIVAASIGIYCWANAGKAAATELVENGSIKVVQNTFKAGNPVVPLPPID